MTLAAALRQHQPFNGFDSETRQNVRIVERFTAEEIIDLAEGRLAAVRRPGFLDAMSARHIANTMVKHPGRKTYRAEPSLGFLGQALYDSNDDAAARLAYFRDRVANTELMRHLCAPYRSPLDTVRLEIEEAWKPGTRVETIDACPLSIGIGRVFQPGSVAHPHQDMPWWDAHFHPDFRAIAATLSFVVYVAAANQGGQLVLFDRAFDWEGYNSNRDERIPYAVRRTALPTPWAIISPMIGELIAFKASSVHAVTTIDSGLRLTLSMFGNVRAFDQPIGFHS